MERTTSLNKRHVETLAMEVIRELVDKVKTSLEENENITDLHRSIVNRKLTEVSKHVTSLESVNMNGSQREIKECIKTFDYIAGHYCDSALIGKDDNGDLKFDFDTNREIISSLGALSAALSYLVLDDGFNVSFQDKIIYFTHELTTKIVDFKSIAIPCDDEDFSKFMKIKSDLAIRMHDTHYTEINAILSGKSLETVEMAFGLPLLKLMNILIKMISKVYDKDKYVVVAYWLMMNKIQNTLNYIVNNSHSLVDIFSDSDL